MVSFSFDIIFIREECDNYMVYLYKCSNNTCSFKFVTTDNTLTNCPNCCDKVDIIDEKYDLSIKQYIPFKYDKIEASYEIKKFMKKSLFIPSSFKKDNNVNNIVQIYIPFFLYDVSVDGEVVFNSYDYRYFKDKTYDYKETSSYLVRNNNHLEFNNILCTGISSLSDDFIKMQPFDYKELCNFDEVGDVLVGIFDLDSESKLEEVKTKCIDTSITFVSNSVKHQESILNNNGLEVTSVSNKIVLLPVFILNTKYRNKNYMFIVNGQTGKVILNTTDTVFGIKEVVIFGVFLFVGLFIITSIVMYFIYRVF